MKGLNVPRAAQLALCILLALDAGAARAGTVSDCSGAGTTSASGTQAVACGYHDAASGAGSAAFGKYNQAQGVRSSAIPERSWTRSACCIGTDANSDIP